MHPTDRKLEAEQAAHLEHLPDSGQGKRMRRERERAREGTWDGTKRKWRRSEQTRLTPRAQERTAVRAKTDQ